MVSISFTANHIKDVQVLSIHQKSYTPQSVSFVEFSPMDIDAINKFRQDLSGSRYRRFYDKQSFEESHIYGLTTQTDCFSNVKSDKILGLVRTNNSNRWILNMQVRNDARTPLKISFMDKILTLGMARNVDRKYKNAGTALLDGLKSVSDRITVFSPKNLVGFFIKNEFLNPLPRDKKYLTWVKPNRL